jgi:hypothetical protein
MHTIWVIENNAGDGSIALDLMGDFAVRRIASLASLFRLRGLHKELQPDMIIVSRTDENVADIRRIPAAFSRSEVYLVEGVFGPGADSGAFKTIPTPFCPIAFVRAFRKERSSERGGSSPAVHAYGELELDVIGQKITARATGEVISLTRKEALVLKKFFERPGACIGRETLLKDVWDGVRVTDRSIDAQICRLRKIVGDFGLTITSVYGQGYILG